MISAQDAAAGFPSAHKWDLVAPFIIIKAENIRHLTQEIFANKYTDTQFEKGF